MSHRNRLQALVLSGIGAGAALLAWLLDNPVDFQWLLKGNIALISMLVAVSFLGLVSQPDLTEGEKLPTGKRSILGTLLGVHFFGAVINLSALFILGDRMSQRRSAEPGAGGGTDPGIFCGSFLVALLCSDGGGADLCT